MAFRFSLEPVLKHRKHLEELAQKEFGEAQTRLEECLKELDRMYERMDEVRSEIFETQRRSSSGDLEMIRSMELFIEGQKIRIKEKRQQASQLMQVFEEKQTLLIEAMQDRKAMEKLKEKKRNEYREKLRIFEMKELDDIVMTRAAGGTNEKNRL